MLEHGGRLHAATARFDIPLADWLDLSTGINPIGWPVATPPAESWSRLPEKDDGLEQAACGYYGADHVLAVAGSQAAIQALPQLRAPSRVSVLRPGYAEHALAWRRAGHTVTTLAAEQLDDAVAQSDVLVLINPNNPTGACFTVAQLLDWQTRLATRGGWLVVDEAFIDVTPAHSLSYHSARHGLIVLRSLGKFFGLAGARVGFVCARPGLLARLDSLLGPWTVSAPARCVATAALGDHVWQRAARRRLTNDSARLHALLERHGLRPTGGSGLFQWTCTPRASRQYVTLARHGILTRLFTDPSSLRFGLPGTESDWRRLAVALTTLNTMTCKGTTA